jgi:hypothetical protein
MTIANGTRPTDDIFHVELLCPCGNEWVSEAFEGELDRPECDECGGEGIRA